MPGIVHSQGAVAADDLEPAALGRAETAVDVGQNTGSKFQGGHEVDVHAGRSDNFLSGDLCRFAREQPGGVDGVHTDVTKTSASQCSVQADGPGLVVGQVKEETMSRSSPMVPAGRRRWDVDEQRAQDREDAVNCAETGPGTVDRPGRREPPRRRPPAGLRVGPSGMITAGGSESARWRCLRCGLGRRPT